jgi:hypothetical protein
MASNKKTKLSLADLYELEVQTIEPVEIKKVEVKVEVEVKDGFTEFLGLGAYKVVAVMEDGAEKDCWSLDDFVALYIHDFDREYVKSLRKAKELGIDYFCLSENRPSNKFKAIASSPWRSPIGGGEIPLREPPENLNFLSSAFAEEFVEINGVKYTYFYYRGGKVYLCRAERNFKDHLVFEGLEMLPDKDLFGDDDGRCGFGCRWDG